MPPLEHSTATTAAMRQVLLALLPGTALYVWLFGLGVLSNIALAICFAFGCEWLALRWRRQPLEPQLFDGSTLITALLFALALPPFMPVWLLLIGSAGAVLIAKHCYGGFGRSSFNPAMAGYALVLVLFPAQLAQWPSLHEIDGITGATALDLFRQKGANTVAAWWQSHPQFGRWGGSGWEWLNLLFLGGGLYLLQRKIIGWHAPFGMLVALGLLAAICYDGGSSASSGSPLMHWLSGATMLAAFFIVTEPVTSPAGKRAQLAYGALIGTVVFAIRYSGGHADGVAFAILLGNACVPLLDRLGLAAARRARIGGISP